jgi:hypothetical protein
MRLLPELENLEGLVVRDKNCLVTIISYFAVVVVSINLNTFKSPLVGFSASVIYWVINTIFLGNAFFWKESTFFRLMFGSFFHVMILGLVGWLTMVLYNLDVLLFSAVLMITTTLSSLFNRRMRQKDATS